jgi:isopenicillin-N epimerase
VAVAEAIVGRSEVTIAALEPPSPEALRQEYLLDPDVIFLNHGSFGACPRIVFDVYQAWQRELERQPVAFVGRRQEGLLNAARAYLASYLNAGPDDLSFVVNATSGLNVIARSLPLAPGDEILTTDLEYGALNLTWEYLCTKAGARYVRQPIPLPVTTAADFVDALWAGVTERTTAIFLSHITSATALILPVAEVCRRAREAGILTIVDGAHAPGQLPLDLTTLGVDIYAGNCHKWLSAPKGAAFLYVRPEQQEWVESLTISWGWSPGHSFVSRNQQQGTRDISAFLAASTAIDFQTTHHWPAVRNACHARLSNLRARLIDRFGTEPIHPDTPEWYSQMVTIPLPPMVGDDRHQLARRLLDVYGIEVPCSAHGDRQFVRVSAQGYTTDADLAALERALVIELAA